MPLLHFDMPFFSPVPQHFFLLTAYNNAEYLPETLQSIRDLQGVDIEESARILLIDDCSTDNTAEVLRGLQPRHPMLQTYRNTLTSSPPSALRAAA